MIGDKKTNEFVKPLYLIYPVNTKSNEFDGMKPKSVESAGHIDPFVAFSWGSKASNNLLDVLALDSMYSLPYTIKLLTPLTSCKISNVIIKLRPIPQALS